LVTLSPAESSRGSTVRVGTSPALVDERNFSHHKIQKHQQLMM
jgi:hypothetical protein